MGEEVGSETNIQWLMVWVISMPTITVIGHTMFKLVENAVTCFYETQCRLLSGLKQ